MYSVFCLSAIKKIRNFSSELVFALITCAVSFQNHAHAVPKLSTWESAVVKVSSFPCLSGNPKLNGSGLLIRYQNQNWVLTSEHVVFHHQGPEICHEVWLNESNQNLNKFETHTAELYLADYQNGLALLKLNQGINLSQAIDFSVLNAVQNVSDESAQVVGLGYPLRSQKLQTLLNGKILTKQSTRANIAGMKALLEMNGLPVEYGMSGGILLLQNADTYSFVGLISHQVLKRLPSSPTEPIDITKPGDTASTDFALGLPAQDIVTWFLRAVKRSSTDFFWTRDWQEQLNCKETLQYGPLVLTIKNKVAQDVWEIGGADGSGVGGCDQPLHNNDHSASTQQESMTTIELSLNLNVTETVMTANLKRSDLNSWRDWLLTGRKVDIVYLKNAGGRGLEKIQSPSQFLTHWFRDKMIAITVRSQLHGQVNQGELLLKKIALATQAVQLLRDQKDFQQNMDVQAWLGYLREQILLSGQMLSSSQDLSILLNGVNDRYWHILYDRTFEFAVNLETSMQNLIAQLKSMGQ